MSCSTLAIADATLWIDLHAGGLIADAFRLEVRWASPDVIIDLELVDPPGETLVRQGLERIEFSPEEVVEASALHETHPSLSIYDAFALLAARERHALLVTGDAALRRAAAQEGVACHGTLWVLAQLVDSGIITPGRAATALEDMLSAGSRLPVRECRRLLQRWRRGPA